jgi:hypothetical protein
MPYFGGEISDLTSGVFPPRQQLGKQKGGQEEIRKNTLDC